MFSSDRAVKISAEYHGGDVLCMGETIDRDQFYLGVVK
jgi:hypothetical protein